MQKIETPPCCCTDRRGFFKRLAANVLGAFITLVPIGAGLALFLDPVRRRTKSDSQFVRVASLAALPADGVPRKFAILASRTDAWTRSPQSVVGAVYLRRDKEGKPQAFNVVCPHAGCFVDCAPARDSFLCPCHNSTFALNGKVNDPKSPSPRGLDELEVEVRDEEVWVRFQNFRAGVAAKIPA
jgi:menaquinol-cytochrome c reductase iron-sulfur subunit